jgi:HEAT repeat protein
MRIVRAIGIFGILFCLIISIGYTQEEEAVEDLTIEELYLSQDIELQIIRSQALSNDRAMKMLAIQTIRSMMQEGSLENNPGIFTVLSSLSFEGTNRQVREAGSIVNNYPMVRKEAANILGEVGGDRARGILMNILEVDPETMVLSEAVYALGKIGDNPNGEVSDRIVWSLSKENAKQAPDNNFAFASLLAIEKIARGSGGIQDPEVVNVLLGVASGNYIKDVRLKAVDVLGALRRSGS